ncbi:MAG: transcriptional repressor [Deltaproteobacteria bacterium]|nr:transcriptional repressor [Deltaproteobacteria bacterium]MBI4196450.1 transcriptional repressor [Deltaproteobacteria bacterium]
METRGKKMEIYRHYLRTKHLKTTKQRDRIVEEFLRVHQHLTVEELLFRVRRQDASIGPATVYRALKLLIECGLASKREFGGGKARYEQGTDRHHDHLICVGCGKIVEFENEEIEKLQIKVCKKNKFHLAHHKMELYGTCCQCQRKGA